jgi:hypothetical protein
MRLTLRGRSWRKREAFSAPRCLAYRRPCALPIAIQPARCIASPPCQPARHPGWLRPLRRIIAWWFGRPPKPAQPLRSPQEQRRVTRIFPMREITPPMTQIRSQETRSTSPWHPAKSMSDQRFASPIRPAFYKPADAAAFLLRNSEAARLGGGGR